MGRDLSVHLDGVLAWCMSIGACLKESFLLSFCYNKNMNTFIKQYLNQFQFENVAVELLNKLFSLVLLYLVFVLLNKMLTASVRKLMPQALKLSSQEIGRQKTLIRLVENSLHYVLYFILIYSVLSILGLPVSSLLAGAGIAGVAIGMGAQGFLSDLVNGFFILLEHQYDVGDQVQVTNGSIRIAGTVVNLGIRTTQVRDADGTLHFVPNRNILVVSNQSRGDMRARIDIPISLEVNLEQITAIIERVHQKELIHYDQIKGCKVLGLQTLANGSAVYRVELFVENGQQTLMYHTFYALYQEALLAAGIPLGGKTLTF